MRCSLAIAVGVAAVLGVSTSWAHRSHSGQDYTKYRQPNGISCCSGHDCRPTRYELRPDGTIMMFPEEVAVAIPRDRINQLPSDDGQAHWCGVVSRTGQATTFCAILPLQLTKAVSPRYAGLW